MTTITRINATTSITPNTPISPITPNTPNTPIFDLPRRFDVHEVERVATSLRSLGTDHPALTIDASAVEMIDLAGLAALTTATDISSLRFVDPSAAFLATVHYTGHDRLAACCATPEFAEAA